ncbi:MAG: hypothetical protein J0I06_06420 [Planctomycetes bacterium]|nr:hypothetical protein [Planctomycetota bacterium]
MALTVPCPKCAMKLLAPDSAVGRQLRCPRCGTLATVPDLLPAEEVQVVEAVAVSPPPSPPPPPPPPAAPPKPKRIVAEEADEIVRPSRKSRRDEEDEEDEEDRPRKKRRPRYVDDDDYDHDRPRRKPRRNSGGSGVLIAGLAIGLMLLLAGVGFAVYLFVGKDSPTVKRAPAPSGWRQHSYPQDGFTVYLPKAPGYVSVPAETFRRETGDFGGFIGGGRGGPFGMGRLNVANDLAEAERITAVSAGDRRDPVRAELLMFKFRDRVPLSIRERFRQASSEGSIDGVEVRTVKWLGNDALEQVHANGVLRVMCTDRHFVIAAIGGPNNTRARQEEEAGFFDNIELVN